MKKITLSLIGILSLASSGASMLSANDGLNIFSDTKLSGELRPRYEFVDNQTNAKPDANAYTIRAMVGFESKFVGIDGLKIKVDGTTVQALGPTRYEDGLNGINRDRVVDPEQSRFTQAYLQYKYGNTTGNIGRQIINLDNQRFIGSVDWRQMPQSLDAVSINDTSFSGLNLYGAYVYSYATIYSVPTQDSKSALLNGSYKVNDMLKITAYDYILSLQNQITTASNFSADTYGASLTGILPVVSASIEYHAEYAKQGNGSFDTVTTNSKQYNNAHYYNIEATAKSNGVSLGVGQELLSGKSGSDGKSKFQTPLATLHKFNGTADMFLITPDCGLLDTYASVGYGAAGLGNFSVVYHDYKADVNNTTLNPTSKNLGNEWDTQYTNSIPGFKGVSGMLKAAYYNHGDITGFANNVTKFWAMLDYKF